MNDRTLVNTGMAYSEKTMETADEVIQALLAALSGKTSEEKNHVLESFARYAKVGGGLHVTQFGIDHLKDFEPAAKANGLTYYAVRDMKNDKVSVIIRDCDIQLLTQMTRQMAEKGSPLYKDPQLYVAEFLDKYKGRDIVFSRVESLEKIKEAKGDAADKGIEFAVGRQQDNSYIVMYLKENYKELVELGIADGARNPSALLGSINIQEVKQIVRQKRENQDVERGKEKEKRYSR